MKSYNNFWTRSVISIALGAPSYPVLFLIRGYPVDRMTNYAFAEYAGVATLTFLALFELQNLKSQHLESKWSWRERFNLRLVSELVSSAVLTLVLVLSAYFFLYTYLWQMEIFFGTIMLFLSLVFFISMSFMAFVNTEYLISYWKDSSEKAAQLERESVRARLEALQNQLSPHFLFNNFSILNGLIDRKPTQAKEFVNRLSEVFRFIIEAKKKEIIELRAELEFIRNYVYVLQARFEEKIHVQISEELQSPGFGIPPVTLQQLIENAVKHNETSYDHPLKIEIQKDCNFLLVTNKKKPRKRIGPSSGTGLLNIFERYKLLTNESVEVIDESDYFSVRLPILKYPKT